LHLSVCKYSSGDVSSYKEGTAHRTIMQANINQLQGYELAVSNESLNLLQEVNYELPISHYQPIRHYCFFKAT